MSSESVAKAKDVLERFGVDGSWQTRADGWWVQAPDLDVRKMTRILTQMEARWITLTVRPASDAGFRLIYHWDLAGALLNIMTSVPGAATPSVADLLPAADWVERELHDYYAIEFLGRDETPALMLRPGDDPGLFTRTGDLGRDVDPAEWEDEQADRREGAT